MAFENLKSTGIAYVLTKLKDYFLQIKDAVRSVNNNEPDENGNITLNTVPYAQNLESSVSQRDYATFLLRTAGGDTSLEDGEAWLMDIKGNNIHDGFVPENIYMSVNRATGSEIEATVDRDTFVAYVATSGTITLIYSTGWSVDPALYGITITGTPVSGDNIVIEYTKEERGTITVANPRSMIATGWNLYNHNLEYAKVVKYEHGYKVSGTYTELQFSATESGAKSVITVTDGSFDIPADGFVWVTGGNSSDTAIWATWTDWTEGYAGDFAAYSQTEVDLSSVIGDEYTFPYGLLKAGSVVDEINLNLGTAIQRVERLDYNAENLATAKASGREYEYDENYIYLALATPVTTSVAVEGDFTANDHGIEWFTYSDAPVQVEILYGNNLVNKLERDVLTKSSDLVNNLTTDDSSKALSASMGKELNDNKSRFTTINAKTQTFTQQAAWEYVFSAIPTGFYGNLYIEFSGGNKAFAMAAKGSSTYGNIIGIAGSAYNPYFFGRSGNTIVFKQMALIS